MARLFGFIGNRADLGARVLELEREPLKVAVRGTPLGWGIGFYQSGEVLLRRRPMDDRSELDPASLASDVRSDVLVGHVRKASVGARRTENTHPFRYRQWLWANTGTIQGFSDELRDRLAGSLPEFLRRDVRGETDSELLFHLFLSFLHDTGHLAESFVDTGATRAALRSTLALVDRLCAEEGQSPSELNVLVTDGEHMVAAHRGERMAYRFFEGRADLERMLGDDARWRRLPDSASCHFTLVASDFDKPPRGWTEVPHGSFVTLTRTAPPAVEAI